MSSELIASVEHSLEVKKSRFLAYACSVDNTEVAMQRLAERQKTPATHHCWAYRVAQQYRFSDDGEPSGSAGKPILAAIDHYQLDHILVVVTRWYGGINLGVGGLMRAYGGCAAECLRLAEKRERIPMKTVWLQCDLALSASVHNFLNRHQGIKLYEEYVNNHWRVQVQIPENEHPVWVQKIHDLSRGSALIQNDPFND